jgi:nitrite reductase/ring-hydroxylating ferredoxin subunit
MQFYSLEKLINLHDGYRKVFKIDHYNLLLIQINGQLHLLESFCPHRGHPLSESDIQENKLRCPLHGYEFSIPEGTLIKQTEEPCRGLKTYDLIYQERGVGVWI